MKESEFINKNKSYWISVEKLIKNAYRTPEATEQAFKKISHDASVAKTFFYNRSIRVYLNGLYADLYHVLYKGKQKTKKSIYTFWSDTIPYAVYSARKELLVAGLVFFIALLIGAISTYMDPEFPRLILGDGYVEQTLRNIESGDPMSIYKDQDIAGMTVGITLNNILVSFYTYVLGIFYMIGSILILFKNGVMVGAFQFFFVNEGLFLESFLTIWMHGTIEIASIVIAGGAGIVLGKGFAFPGTYSRLQSFIISARQSIIILISLIPLFVFAGTIEGTITRLTEVNDGVRAFFILLCAAFIVFYYMWYPYHKSKVGFSFDEDNQKIVEDLEPNIPRGYIVHITTLFYFTIATFNKYSFRILSTSLLLAGLSVLYIHFFSLINMHDFIVNNLFISSLWGVISYVFYNANVPFLHAVQICIFMLLSWFSISLFNLDNRSDNRWFYVPKSLKAWMNLIVFCMISAFILLLPFLLHWVMVFILPIVYISILGLVYDKKKVSKLLPFSFSFISIQIGLNYFFTILLSIIFLLVLYLFNSSMTDMIVQFIIGNFNMDESLGFLIKDYIYFFTTSFSLYLMLQIYILGLSYLYLSILEIYTADVLLDEVKSMGKKKEIKGMERE